MMPHARAFRLGLLAPATFALVLGGCDQFKFKGHVTTWKTEDGKTTVHHREVDKLEDMPGAIADAADEFAADTAKLIKKLTDVPPPGQVKLGDLTPGLKQYEGNTNYDFLIQAKEKDGKPIDFKYVRIGVNDYDTFFKTTCEIYALTYQTRQSLHRMRELAAAVLDEDVKEETAANVAVTKALGSDKAQAKSQFVEHLTAFKDVGAQLAGIVPQIVGKVGTLVNAGKNLILGAPAAITNPKVVLHLGLIKQGLGDSVKVIGEAGKNLGAIVSDVTGFGGGDDDKKKTDS
jgi:hypothetical protein